MPVILFTLITMIVNHRFASNKNFVTGLTQRQSWTMSCILSFIIILVSSVLWRRIICLIGNICPSNSHQNFQRLHHRVALCFVWAMAECILGWVNHIDMSFEYLRFNMWCNEQGGIHAAAEHQSAITVPYRSKDICDIFLF
ncbi:hypothetical protein ES288_A06G044300v1 [Gossypium darwinii]|uniref:Uncharacterized protein n=2 Tax=Gossypium TaxID=3633 RepID=A0A5D2PZX0_GOSTO|nr:hypothetical protein ES288_A06G044300v1 [Gossypium darwinii]TYI21529.1 hypothetical protein ES332_A06G043700v1 [Gossypium tomentosum]